MQDQFEDGDRVYVDDNGDVAVLHDAYVCKECGFIWPWTLGPTDGAECDNCEKAADWEWVK